MENEDINKILISIGTQFSQDFRTSISDIMKDIANAIPKAVEDYKNIICYKIIVSFFSHAMSEMFHELPWEMIKEEVDIFLDNLINLTSEMKNENSN